MATTDLLDLPNELVLHILALFPTSKLLSLTAVSHRFHALILRLLQARLLQAAQLPDHTLLLECFHPALKFNNGPPLHCLYLGTPGLDNNQETGEENSFGSLSALRALYSTFQPHRRRTEVAVWRRPGDIPGSRTHPSSSPQSSSPAQASGSKAEATLENGPVTQALSLEDHELFTQLCAVLNLVRCGPRIGLFRSFVTVDESVVRVWKDWLGRRHDANNSTSLLVSDSVNCSELQSALPSRDVKSKGISTTSLGMDVIRDESILWFDLPKNVGLRVCVREKKWSGNPATLLSAHEDAVVSYEVEYKELIVRASHLLLCMEKSLSQQDNATGRAVVFGSWD